MVKVNLLIKVTLVLPLMVQENPANQGMKVHLTMSVTRRSQEIFDSKGTAGNFPTIILVSYVAVCHLLKELNKLLSKAKVTWHRLCLCYSLLTTNARSASARFPSLFFAIINGRINGRVHRSFTVPHFLLFLDALSSAFT